MNDKTVYLAGPITGLTYEECTEWRDKAKAELAKSGITAYSPMRGKGYLSDGNPIEAFNNRLPQKLSTQKGIVGRDYFDATRSDVVLCNLLGAKSRSIGTIFELAWRYQKQLPVVLVMEDTGNVHDHPFINESVTYRTNNIDEGIELVKHILVH